jgi:hypothetical protein
MLRRIVYPHEGLRVDRIMDDARMTFSYYVTDDALDAPRSANDVVFTRWLCSCGGGGTALDSTTFQHEVLSHLRSRHGGTRASVVGNVRQCSPALLAFLERQILGSLGTTALLLGVMSRIDALLRVTNGPRASASRRLCVPDEWSRLVPVALNPRKVALTLASIRIANGLMLATSPALAEFAYLGPGGATPTGRALARFTGVRELAFGTLAYLGIIRGKGAAIVGAGALCDAVDCVISVRSPGVDRRMRLAAPTAALSALAGGWAARALSREEQQNLPD